MQDEKDEELAQTEGKPKVVSYPFGWTCFCGLLLAAIVNKICTSFHVSRPTVCLGVVLYICMQ